ncbi:MAG: hypothetical protein ABSG51_04650 [Terracidiphilus sp.]
MGLEATGNDRWFRKLVMESGHELLVGDARAIHASAPREQQTDKPGPRRTICFRWGGSGMRGTFSGCWWRTGFQPSGSPRWPTSNSGSC